MKVWTFTEHSGPVDIVTLETDDRLKNKFIDPLIGVTFMTKLNTYFKDKNFGKDVKEIFYYQRCLMAIDNYKIPELYQYSKRLKKITAYVELDYDFALIADVPTFAHYIATEYLKISEDFDQLTIKEFDHEAYIAELKTFFSNNGLLSKISNRNAPH